MTHRRQRARALHQQEQQLAIERTQRMSESAKPPFDLSAQIRSLLDRCESGEVSAWWRLNVVLSAQSDGRLDGGELEPDLTLLPAWETCDSDIQRRLVRAARRYVMEQDPVAEGWLVPTKLRFWMGQRIGIHRPAFAGYRALMLLQRHDPEALSNLSEQVWRRWAPILVTFPSVPNEEVQETHDALMRSAYYYATDEIIASFVAQCRLQNRERGELHGLDRVTACWDERFSDAVLVAISRVRFRDSALQSLLTALVDHASPTVRAAADRMIRNRGRGKNSHSQAIIAAGVLLTRADDAGWPIVWPTLRRDGTFAREVFLSLQRFPTRGMSIGARLSDEQVADLFIYVATLFPFSEDPSELNGFVTADQYLAQWRNSLVSQLPQRRTPGAVEALRRVAEAFPDYFWLRLQLQEAEDLHRYNSWRPVSVETMFRLAADKSRRLVENGQQLLDVLIESLERLDQELQGETPTAPLLWNEPTIKGGKIFTPKDEGALSDYVKAHLERDLRGRGIIANREVEVRKGRGSSGEVTDVHVDAVVRRQRGEQYDPITAIIEVKGCWHRDVLRAMETQLTLRYLRDNQCRHGLYLVGWYMCSQWDGGDHRKGDTPRLTIEQARELFAEQAAEVSRRPDLGVQVRSFVLDVALR